MLLACMECSVDTSLDKTLGIANLQWFSLCKHVVTKNATCKVLECVYSRWVGVIRALVSILSCGVLFNTSDSEMFCLIRKGI